MPFTFGGVTFTIHAESMGPEATFEDDNSAYAEDYDVTWDNRQLAVRSLLGYARTTGGLTKYVARFLPWSIPEWQIDGTTIPYLYCRRVVMRGLGPRSLDATQYKRPQYVTARLACSFDTPAWDFMSDTDMVDKGYKDANNNPDESSLVRYVVVDPKPSGEYFSIPTGTFKYVNDNTVVAQGIGKLNVYANLAITRIAVPWDSVPSWHVNTNLSGPAAIDTNLGRVNSLPITRNNLMGGSGVTYPRGTLLLTAVSFKPRKSPLGIRTYDYTCYFRFFWPNQGTVTAGGNSVAIGHEFLYRPLFSPPGWQEVVAVAPGGTATTNLVAQTDGKSIYDWGNMLACWRNP